MGKLDQAKMLMQVKKVQKELKKTIIEAEGGGGAVVVEMTGEQKLKKVHIDPDEVDLEDIGQLESWIEEAFQEAIAQSQKVAAEKMAPFMGMLGNLGL
ncbi:YbaB/EbfC family nucleoid-associated protein [Candidatus Saccharibacteria bacterium]|nr:YbaB/EbfC family nucleoid-associated protein [Candidatus Saccharibacteria bacterium]MCB9821496.1 YbaB/EbfC family nucleoid-associated protein [Candidatus Nomurabacteria bacterium]